MRAHHFLGLFLIGCGGSAAAQVEPATASASAAVPAEAPAGTSPAAASEDAVAAPAPGLPLTCIEKGDVCAPPGEVVERLCAKPHQDAALALFSRAPFTRMYLRGKMDELVFDEEVLVLRYHAVAKNGIQVGSSTGSYDVLRWDGTCSRAVDAEMLTKSKPPRPRSAKVQWHRLADKTQMALIGGSEAVKKAHSKRGKECKGAMSGDVSSACEKADAALVDAVVEYVRGGGNVPVPDAL